MFYGDFEEINFKKYVFRGRWGHTMTVWKDRIYLLGGYNKRCFMDELVILDCFSKRAEIKRRPEFARSNHTAHVYKNCLLALGGGTFQNGYVTKLNDLLVIDPKTGTIRARVETSMSKCNGHVSQLVGDKLFIFGGMDVFDKVVSELTIIDLETFKRWLNKAVK